MDLITCIHLQLLSESRRISLKTDMDKSALSADDYQLTASQYAIALLSLLPLQEQTTRDLLAENIFPTMARLFWSVYTPLLYSST